VAEYTGLTAADILALTKSEGTPDDTVTSISLRVDTRRTRAGREIYNHIMAAATGCALNITDLPGTLTHRAHRIEAIGRWANLRNLVTAIDHAQNGGKR